MQPNFALRLSQDRITLLHRGKAGWHPVGHVSPQAADLDNQLAMLRATATAMSPSGLSCKLIIPDSQILYRETPDPGGAEDECAAEVRSFLDGGTPYRLEDLVWDYCSNGHVLFIAACARDTLEEAESFARQHRFNPVSFVASPDAGGFDREVFFGTTTVAATLLAEGEVLVPDNQLMRVLGDEPAPPATPNETGSGAEPDAGSAAEPEAAPVPEIIAETIAAIIPEPAAETGAETAPDTNNGTHAEATTGTAAGTIAGPAAVTAAEALPESADVPETTAADTAADGPADRPAPQSDRVLADQVLADNVLADNVLTEVPDQNATASGRGPGKG
jgi:hypothetical protein